MTPFYGRGSTALGLQTHSEKTVTFLGAESFFRAFI